jgi:CHAD domain-containing protein
MRIKESMSLRLAVQKLAASELARVRGLKRSVKRGDVEGVHDFRAGLRRIRALLEITPGKEAKHLRMRAGKFARALGAVRDLDVVLIQIQSGELGSVDASAWAADLESQRKDRLSESGELLNGRFGRWSRRLVDWSREKVDGPSVSEGLSMSLRHIVEAARLHFEGSSEEDLHSLRIGVKKARYLVELFADILPTTAADVAKRLETAQDAFGAVRDRQRLIELAEERPELSAIMQDLPRSTEHERLTDLARQAFMAVELLILEPN